MQQAHLTAVPTGRTDIELAIIAPDGREAMLQHAGQLAQAGIPFVFDPGQGLPKFGGEELLEFVRLADYVTVNDYEGQLLQERTGKKLEELAKLVRALVVTMGGRGSIIHTNGQQLDIP